MLKKDYTVKSLSFVILRSGHGLHIAFALFVNRPPSPHPVIFRYLYTFFPFSFVLFILISRSIDYPSSYFFHDFYHSSSFRFPFFLLILCVPPSFPDQSETRTRLFLAAAQHQRWHERRIPRLGLFRPFSRLSFSPSLPILSLPSPSFSTFPSPLLPSPMATTQPPPTPASPPPTQPSLAWMTTQKL